MKKTKDIEVKIIKQEADVLLKNGERVALNETIKKENVRGIVLGSGKVISLKVRQTPFSENKLIDYPSSRFLADIERAKKDMRGSENTDLLTLCCCDSGLTIIEGLGEDEYIPSVGELLEIFPLEFDKINRIRKALGLDPLPTGYYWTSSIRTKETMWIVCSNGDADWSRWHDFYRNNFYVLAFVRE